MQSLTQIFRRAQPIKVAAMTSTPIEPKGKPVELKPQDLRSVTGGLPAIGGLSASQIAILPNQVD